MTKGKLISWKKSFGLRGPCSLEIVSSAAIPNPHTFADTSLLASRMIRSSISIRVKSSGLEGQAHEG